ncbi:P-loop containing nucleoside triphosphate hydrolase protein, partial [Macrolepiota fuliginosa MF-IS2]
DMFRGIFKFPAFNAMQSSCFDHVGLHLVFTPTAPTGSGKTVLFELAIITLLSQTVAAQCKIVYMAPTKALCSERARDWTTKLDPLGIKTCELTGDTVQFGRSAWGDAKKSSIIPQAEKWDSLTRTWQDRDSILSQIRLFLVDEVHILNESRGSTLEVVISRMKSRNESIRFLLVSATVPNIRDIANWIGSNRNMTCEALEFGEEYRPCKLTRLVIGVPRSNKQNEFQYARTLDNQLFPVLQQHSAMKPILIFCSTRNGTLTSAAALLKAYEEAAEKKERLPWVRAARCAMNHFKQHSTELATHGIGVHHGGLAMDDRRLAEDLFLDGSLRVLVATSTLSVGVNLPAHTVIIRGVKLFQNNANIEYCDLDIMQMIGRAGRPQFDRDGLAIIMCEPQLAGKYQTLTQGKTVLESSLHHNMLEHLNSEIALGSITSVDSAKDWLRGSFLYQRLQHNPRHYALQQEADNSWHEKLNNIILRNVSQLESTNLIRQNQDASGERLESTEYGDIMSKLYVRQATMAHIMNLHDKPTLREILETIAAAEEFSSLRLRASEKPVYNELRTHNDIRYAVAKVEKTSDKVFLLIQAILGNIPLNTSEMRRGDTQPQLDALSIFKHATRLAKGKVAITKQLGTQLMYGLEATRCLAAKAWEDRSTVLRQVEQIGEKSLKVLTEHGITTLDLLRQQPPARIEILLNRKSPFGHDVLASLGEIPKYQVKASQLSVTSDGGKSPVSIKLTVDCELLNPASTTKYNKKHRYNDMTAILTLTSDFDWIDFRRTPHHRTKALKETKSFGVGAVLTKPSQSITVLVASETFAGTLTKYTIKPDVPPKEFPTPNTRPLSTLALELEEFENDPGFWNVTFDEVNSPSTSTRDLVAVNLLTNCWGLVMSTERTTINNDCHQNLNEGQRLPNGNYKCNHTCSDKTKCLHLCCREGKPRPGNEKGQTSSGKAKADWTENVQRGLQRRSRGKTVPNVLSQTFIEQQMKGLGRLHNQSGVQGSFEMQKNIRLKLDATPLGRKRKARHAIGVQFTEVEASVGATNAVVEDVLDNNDHLPSVEELLSGGRQSSVSLSADPQLPIRTGPKPGNARKRARIDPTAKVSVHMSTISVGDGIMGRTRNLCFCLTQMVSNLMMLQGP